MSSSSLSWEEVCRCGSWTAPVTSGLFLLSGFILFYICANKFILLTRITFSLYYEGFVVGEITICIKALSADQLILWKNGITIRSRCDVKLGVQILRRSQRSLRSFREQQSSSALYDRLKKKVKQSDVSTLVCSRHFLLECKPSNSWMCFWPFIVSHVPEATDLDLVWGRLLPRTWNLFSN